MTAAAAVFRLLGDDNRLRLLWALHGAELCVCDLATLVATTPSAVSHQLRLLRTAGLVRRRREGKMVYYRLGEGPLGAVLLAGLGIPAAGEGQ